MPRIEGELQTEIENATECGDLACFSCGDGRLPAAEEDVEGLIREIHAGDWPDAVLRVTRELPEGRLVGVVAVEPASGPLFEYHPLLRAKDYEHAAFIVVLALSASYRGREERFTCQHGTPLSEVLLVDALHCLAEWNEGVVPLTQGVVARANTPSRALIERHGFRTPIATKGDLYYVRARGHPLPTVAAGTLCACLTVHGSDPETPTNLESS
jgi:hypothetical protein